MESAKSIQSGNVSLMCSTDLVAIIHEYQEEGLVPSDISLEPLQGGIPFKPADKNPDILLLKLDNDPENELKICNELANANGEKSVFIIVASSDQSLDIKLKCYDAGVRACINYPLVPKDLATNIQTFYDYCQEYGKFRHTESQLRRKHRNAITIYDEQVSIVEFFERSLSCRTGKDVIDTVFRAMRDYGLQTSVQIRSSVGNMTLKDVDDSSTKAHALESDLLFAAKDSGRLTELGKRLLVNFDKISLLVKNIYTFDEETVGRFRDHLAVIMRGAESRIKTLEKETARRNDLVALNEVLETASKTLDEFGESSKNLKETAVRKNNELIQQIITDFLSLGLDEDQEKYLLALIEGHLDSISELFEASKKVDNSFSKFTVSLEAIIERANENLHESDPDDDEDELSDGSIMLL